MIASMEKYKFLLLHAEQEKFLHTLGEIGVVDITVGEYTPNQEELQRITNLSILKNCIDSLTNYGFGRNFDNVAPPLVINTQEAIAEFTDCWTRREAVKVKIARLEKDIAAAEMWGTFRIGRVAQLQHVGIDIRYFSCAAKDYDEAFETQYSVALVSKTASTAYFIGISRGKDEFLLPDIHYTEHKRLSMDVNELNKKHAHRTSELDAIEAELDSLYTIIPMLKESIEEMKVDIRQKRIEEGTTRAADNSLVVIEGWCPKNNTKELEDGIESFEGVVSFRESPIPEDNPPIKLSNSKLFSPAEIITRLFSLPNYQEIDMTPFFAPFFIFFVGMCLGDAIYGAIFFVGALIARFKMKAEFKPVTTLVMWCSGAAILMGAITGTYGGMTVEATMLLDSNQLFYFALGVGVLQILYAMVLQAYFRIKRFGFLYGLSQIGWVMTLITTLAGVLLPMVGQTWFSTSSPVFLPLLIISLILTIFFQNPKKNPFVNFGAGLWFLYNGVTGMLSDTLSYVRLFALGLSGGIIAGVFNTLAYELSPDIPVVKYLVMLLILAIGHGINIFMSAISAFVHPLRLTFVEFYKNVGFEGGGRMYDPFIKKTK